MEIGIENGDGARMREIENGRVANEDKIDKEDQNSSGYVEGGADIDDSNDSAQFETDFGVSTMVLSSDDRVEKKAEVLVRGLSPAKDEAPVANDIPHTNIESVEEVELLVSEEIQVMGRSDTDQGLISEAEKLTDNVAKTNGEIGLSDTVDGDSPVNVNILVSEGSPIVGQAGTEEVSADKVEGLRDNVVENGISNLRDVTEISGDGKVVVDLSDEDHKAHENGVSVCDSMNTGSQEKQVYGLPEFQNVDEAEGTDFQDVPKFNDDTMSRSPTVNSVDQTNGTPSTGKQEKGAGLNNVAAEHGSKNHDDKAEEEKGIGANLKNEIKEPKIPDIKENEAEIVQLEYLENGDNEPNLPVSTFYQDENPTMRDEISSVMAEIAEEPPIEESPNSLDNSYVEERTIDTVLQNSLPKEVKKEEMKSSKPELNLSKKMSDKDERYTPRMREQEAKPVMNDSSTVQSATPAPGHPHLPARPAGLGRAAPLLEPAPRIVQQPRVNGATVMLQNQLVEEPSLGEAEEYDETRQKLQMIRVKFLRLAHRLGQTPHNVVVAQVLYRLGLAEQLRGRSGGRVAAFSFDRASAMAEQLEAAGREPLDFTCTIMVLGKSGVGKSATINSIFDEVKFGTDAFHLGTKRVQDVVGTVQGIKVRVIDTPGLLSSWSDQRQNERILHSVKQFIKKTPPDIVLYLDRLDMPSRDFGDMPLLRTITETFGPSIWFNAIVVLTHAASAPPEGPNGTATSYDMFVTQRSHAVQQEIRQAAGDMRLMNPVSLVENHSACRTNRAGQRVLPNGQVWKPHLLLLSFASKILTEANMLLKLQESPPGRSSATRSRAPPLPYLLSSLLQSRPQVKLPTEQFEDEDDLLDDLEDDQNSEDESEYDQLPPFRSLTKAQLAKLPKDQRKAYYAELEYREKLLMKKQLKEEKLRRKMMKKMQAMVKDFPSDYGENAEEESGDAASVPVPMPDLSLPSSFDSDNPTHRYRSLDSNNQWLIRPVLEPNGWDHDVGYEGINLEKLIVVKEKVPISFSGQVSKDKKEASLQMEVATSMKHGEGKATSLGFDLQSVGKDIAYTLRGETKFCNYRRNKATAGASLTILGDAITGGVKVEDKLIVHKRGQIVVSGGTMFGRGDAAYGGSLEATLRDKDHPLGRFLSTLGLSVMDYHGDLALGCNSQTQIPVGRHTNLIGRVNINNRGAGQVSIRLNSSEQLQIALVALVPFARKLFGYWQPAEFV
ncbi:small GTPase [Lithospermum erythrorhizon]|uniref:Small GTPase n=1 Tax=Lithospermum erythrorhizon TaxID=34254 RepID=A0AAV3QWT2_LITER